MRICLRKNGFVQGQVLNSPDTLEGLLAKAKTELKVNQPVLYSSTGDIITTLDVIREDDIIYAAEKGEDFTSASGSSRATAFAEFSAKKQAERELFFKRTTTNVKKVKKGKNTSDVCKLNIGMMEWRPYQKRKRNSTPKLVFRKQVGQRMSVSLSVRKDASASDVIEKSLSAFKLIDPDINSACQKTYVLLYPNLNSKVEFLPQSEELFTPRKYVELLGTFYSKLRFYLISNEDWIASSNYASQYQSLEETCESETDDPCPKKTFSVDSDSSDNEVHFKGNTPEGYRNDDDEDLQCFICNLSEKPVIRLSKCRDVFHKHCISEWVENCKPEQPRCPKCKEEFNGKLYKLKANTDNEKTEDKGWFFRQYILPTLVNVNELQTSDEEVGYEPYTDGFIPTLATGASTSSTTDSQAAISNTNNSSATDTQASITNTNSSSANDNQASISNTNNSSATDTQALISNTNSSSTTDTQASADNASCSSGNGDTDGLNNENPLQSPTRTRKLQIKRENILMDLLNAFKDPSIMKDYVEIIMINAKGEKELGQDLGGVFRDTIAGFWASFYDAATVGEDERIPALRHDFQMDEWESVCRIFVKGFLQQEYFPIKLCKVFVLEVLFGEECITEDLVIQSLLRYLSRDEREIVEATLSNGLPEDQESEFLEFLDRFNCKRVPKDNNEVRQVILEIAHKELIQTSEYVSNCWRRNIHLLKKHPHFKSVSSILDIYRAAIPTTRQFVAMLSANPSNNAEQEVFGYLKRYIRGLNGPMLSKFLRFCTGSDVMCSKTTSIAVSFTGLEGFARRVVAHTCGLILEVPRTYESFPVFRQEMNNILESGIWDIDFV